MKVSNPWRHDTGVDPGRCRIGSPPFVANRFARPAQQQAGESGTGPDNAEA